MTLESPYKGLEPFDDSDVDALLFFGREREREIVVANLIAARLTVLYGPTGVGKSSLLRAGVTRALRELPEDPLVVVFDRWGGDPSADLAVDVGEASGNVVAGRLLEVIDHIQRDRDVYLILDQTEEYFVYNEAESAFEAELARLVTEPLRVNVLLSLREDSLARLDRFKPRLPTIYANSLRLDRLDREAGRAAIVRPVERWNELEGDRVAVDPELVEAVLDGVRGGGIEEGVGLGGVQGDGSRSTVEAPYLQLVMQRIWDVERAADSAVLRASTLSELGGARRVVADHLEHAMEELTPDERDVASQLFTYLVTPSGTKIAHALTDLAEYAGVAEARAGPVVETLSRHRILRPDEAGRTEIFHDVLAGEVLGWRRSHAAVRALEQAKSDARRRHRRLLWFAGLASAAFLLMTFLAVFALSERSNARDQAREAKAHELEASAAAQLDRDPELSVLLALEAARRAPSQSSEETLRTALLASRTRTVVDAGKPLLGAIFRGHRLVIAATDGDVVVADARTGRKKHTSATRRAARAVSFASDGTALLTGHDGRLRLVSPRGDVAVLPPISGARGAALSPDGSIAAVFDPRGVRLVAARTGNVQQSISRRGVISAAITRDNRWVVTGGADEAVRVWSVRTGQLVRALPHQEKHAVAVAFSPRGAFVASASSDGLGRIWSVTERALIATLSGGAIGLTDVAFSTDGAHIVTASRDGIARVSKADTGASLFELSGHRERVASAAFSGAAGTSVVTASADGTARVWDAVLQPEVDELARVGSAVRALGFPRPDVVRVDWSGGTSMFSAKTGERLDRGAIPSASTSPRVRAQSPDGSTAAIRGKTVVLRVGGRTTILKGHADRVLAVSFSPDGSLLATASRDRDVRIWNVATGETVRILPHNSAVRDVEFSPNGRWLVTAAAKATLWDARDGEIVVRLQTHARIVTAAVFDPSGLTIVTGDIDGGVGRYRCGVCGGLDELMALAERRLARTGREFTAAERERYLR